MKLAIVHDWIGNMGGAERVLKELTRIWPEAPVYTLFANKRTLREHFPHTDIRTTWLNRVPGISWAYPYLAPFMPSTIESLDLSDFDIVLTSSVAFAKGIIVRPGTRHICYCYSPTRMLWDRSINYERKGYISRIFRHFLRAWDYSAAARPDQMVAISDTVARRITKYYNREAMVIPPPVRTHREILASSSDEPGDYFLIVGRLVPHKNIDVAIEAFDKLRFKLVVVGDGPLSRHLRSRAGKNVEFMGEISDEELGDVYAGCKALIIPNEEDFGMTAIEAMAHGKPVLALRSGGVVETITEGMTGEFFDDPIPEALADGIRRINAKLKDYDRNYMREQAARYSPEHFEQRMRILIEQC